MHNSIYIYIYRIVKKKNKKVFGVWLFQCIYVKLLSYIYMIYIYIYICVYISVCVWVGVCMCVCVCVCIRHSSPELVNLIKAHQEF